MPAKKEKQYLLVNRQTNNFSLPVYRETEVIYEDLEPNEQGQYVKVFKKRTEPIGAGSVTLPGSHHRKLVTDPTKTLVNQATLDQFKANPIFNDLVSRSLIQIEEAPADYDPADYADE